MFSKTINELTERKRLLVLQSDLHRGVLAVESAALAARINSTRHTLQSGGLLLAGSAAAGLLATLLRKRESGQGLGRWIPVITGAWRWFRSFRSGNREEQSEF